MWSSHFLKDMGKWRDDTKAYAFHKSYHALDKIALKFLFMWCLLFLTIKYESMYNKKSAQFIDLNASTKLAGVVSVKQSQQIDFVCLFFSSPNAKSHILLFILGP